MKDILMQYKDTCIIFIKDNSIIAYDEHSILLEYLSSFKSHNNMLKIKYKYLNYITNILKKRHINYVVLDTELNNNEYDKYISEYNKYHKYIIKSNKYNNIRKKYVNILNIIFFIKKRT